jgi:hypothetical protein
MNKNKVNIPSKVLSGKLLTSVGKDLWNFNDGDEYWSGGSQPRFYTWNVTLSVSSQRHSSSQTRKPYFYDGLDINTNMWIAEQSTGIALKITSITSKTETTIDCVVEDYLRYNTLRFSGGTGNGIFGEDTPIVIFQLNEDNLPLIDPVPTTTSSSFYPNLMSRFSFTAKNYYFELYKINHDFKIGDLISADPAGSSFQKTSPDYPHIIGEVTYTSNGSSVFLVDPFQQINEDFDSLIGDVGQVIYANASDAGGMSLMGNLPVMIKLRNNTNSFVIGSGSSTDAGGIVKLNGISTSVGDGSASDFVSYVNANTNLHGCVASLLASPTVISSDPSQLGYGEPAFYITGGNYPVASINGVNVTFTTTTVGEASYGDTYALEEDLATDINAANIPFIVASTEMNKLKISNTDGGPIDIVNITPDSSGYHFAGTASASGLPLSTPANTSSGMIRLDAVDARAINVYDEIGTAVDDFGLYSSENGIKAAGIVIEQGLRTSSSYVVTNIPARDSLNAVFGDICFVTDKGNSEWGYYIYTLASEWVKFADKDSAATDAQSLEIEIDAESDLEGLIAVVSNGSGINMVTVKVIEAFDAPATVSVGDDINNVRLMDVSLNDLTVISEYSYTPSYHYTTGGDTNINYYLNLNGATTGRAKISISYS